MSARTKQLSYACPKCQGNGRVVSIGKYVAQMVCPCGNRWTTHATAEMMQSADRVRANAVAKACR